MNKYKILLIILMLLGLIWRLVPLSQNYSFWTDEEHVAIFSKAVLGKGKPVLASGFDIGIYQLPMYWLGALGTKIFGDREIAIRWPSLVFGVLTIGVVYLLATKLFSKKVGLLAAFLTTFLNIEILWSIQARPYQAIQFFWLLGTYFSSQYLERRQKKYLIWTIVCGLMAEFFHPLGSLFLFTQLVLYLIWDFLFGQKKNLPRLILVLFFVNLPLVFYISFDSMKTIFSFDNFFYYRIFLFKNYLPLIFFSLIGLARLFLLKKHQSFLLLFIPLTIQMFVVSFFVARQPFIRYFYPVFQFIILLASYGVWEMGNWVQKNIKYKIFQILNIKYKIFKILNIKYKILNIKYSVFSIQYFFIFLLVFSLWKIDKLSLSPRKIYSLNADMQEIPEVDWEKLYFVVEAKLKLNPNAILVTNWMDTPVWFLGEGKLNYLLRKSGLEVDLLSGAKYINSLDIFLSLIKEKPAGILVLDSWDLAVPEKVREFCRDNLKKEMGIDRLYSSQPRYWPVTVYSWGIK